MRSSQGKNSSSNTKNTSDSLPGESKNRLAQNSADNQKQKTKTKENNSSDRESGHSSVALFFLFLFFVENEETHGRSVIGLELSWNKNNIISSKGPSIIINVLNKTKMFSLWVVSQGHFRFKSIDITIILSRCRLRIGPV